MTKKHFRLFVWSFLMMLGMTQTAMAADFKDFSVIVNNQTGTLLTSEEQVQGTSFSFGVAVAADGTVSRVEVDDESSIATVSGKYHSDHGSTGLQVVVPVNGNVKITVGQCTYSTNTITVKNSNGETVVSKTPSGPACWKNNRSNVDELYYTGDATTLTISGMGYCPYVAVEAVEEVITKYTVNFSLGSETAEGVVPAGSEVVADESVTIPANFTLYKEGYTLTGWTDGTNTFATGTTVTPESDLILTPVFTENSVALADRTSPVTLKWTFRRDAGAPTVQFQNVTGIWVTQATVNGETIDVKLDFNTSPGKLNNSSWNDWAQVNNGTTFTIPSCKGATVSMEAYSTITTTTIDGQSDYTQAQTISYEVANSAETIDVVIGDGSYYRYIQTVLPVVASSGGTTYTDEEASVIWNFNTTTNGVADTVVPSEGFSMTGVDLGDLTVTGLGTRSADDKAEGVTFVKLKPAGSTTAASWVLKPASGLTFTPTKVSMWIQRFGTDAQNGVTISAKLEDGTSVTLGNYTAPRANKTQAEDKYGSSDNYTNYVEIELTENQQQQLATSGTFTLSATVGVGNTKEGGFSDVRVYGLLNGTAADVNKYSIDVVASPEEGGSINVYPLSEEYEEGTEVTLTAIENFGYDFVNWTNAAGEEVSTEAKFKYTVNSDETLTANFVQVETYELALTVDGTNDYMVTVNPAPTVVDGKYMYEAGQAVQLTANQYENLVTFTNWSDGETNSSKLISMTEDIEITAFYAQADIIAGWDFYTAGNNGRKADFAAQDNDADALNLVLTADPTQISGWLDKSTLGAGGYESFAGAAVNWRTGSSDGDVGNWHWQTKVNAAAFESINVQFQMLYNYNAYQTYLAEYSLDGENWTQFGSITMTGAKQVASFSEQLPAEANNQTELYIRMRADKENSNVNGTASANDGNTLAMFFITGTPKLVDDGTAPVLISTVPTNGATGASASGKIVLTFDERVKLADNSVATLGNMTLTPTVSGKTVTFEYKGLEYGTEYTFTLPGGSIADLTNNFVEDDITLSFTTMIRPSVTKGIYDYVVENVDDLMAAIAEAQARSDKNVRYRVFIKNGEYTIPLYSTTKTCNGYEVPECITFINTDNLSMIGESRDGVIITNGIDKNATFAGTYGTTSKYDGIGNSDVFQLRGQGYYWQDLTVESGMDDATGRDLAIHDRGTQNIYKNVGLRGYQDTWTSNNDNGLYYFEDGYVRGRTDYMCGKGDIFWNRVELRQIAGGYASVPSKPKQYGWIYKDCTINGEGSNVDGNYTLGRPWGSGTPIALFIDTKMNVVPSAIGWNEMSGGWPARFAEYNSMTSSGSVIDLSGRKKTFGDGHTNNPVLTAEEALENSDLHRMYGDWDPTLLTEQAPAPANVVLSGNTLTWDNSNYVFCWAIVKDGRVIDFTTEPTYEVDDASATYAVRAANEMGGLGEATEAVLADSGIVLTDTDTEAPAPGTYATVTYDRKLYSGLNTLVLPFETTREEINATYVLRYTGTTEEDGVFTLNFEEVSDLQANVPYAVIIEADDISLPVFENKTVVEADDLTVSDDNFSFVGTYTDFGKNNSIVKNGDYVAGAAKFKKAAGGNRVAAYRAYFKNHTGNSAAMLAFNFAGINIGSIVSEDGGFVDGINQANADAAEGAIYNVQGIRVKNATKGVYIQNGKKVVVK
ncbi:MAG: Ig-like domain-containing protein [Prevotella sp.]|nr:Ig-like domain-containing protein [Prevotella sp.]